MSSQKNKLSAEQEESLLNVLEARFENNMNRHENIKWDQVLSKLKNTPEKLWTLDEMERTEGEPDVTGYDEKTNEYIFVDCSPESPKGRRSLCYDHEALEKRKENKPKDSALNLASEMGVKILNEAEYRELQKLGRFDTKTSSWIMTPDTIRKLGGAVFADFRYDTVFVYHNGADSYYAARGFRGSLRV